MWFIGQGTYFNIDYNFDKILLATHIDMHYINSSNLLHSHWERNEFKFKRFILPYSYQQSVRLFPDFLGNKAD